jgi:hypothetical protein
MPGTTKQDLQAERLQAIRLRSSINTHLEDCGITTPASIGAARRPAGRVRRLLSVVRDRIPARFANNYDRDVFNGDLGVITGLDAEEGSSSSPSTAGR